MQGMQLWLNLSKKEKMTRPEYYPVSKIPEIILNNAAIKIIAGEYNKNNGPVSGFDFFDIKLDKGGEFKYRAENGKNTFCFIIDGDGEINSVKIKKLQLALPGKEFYVKSDNMRLILASGSPINEEIAWGGPIVMNTEEELRAAFEELNDGTFIKNPDNFNHI